MKNQDVLVSVIVPAYNTPENYFRECLDSLVNQSYQNLEIIVVDDGSKKEFADVYDKLAETYSKRNIKVFHRKNSGVSASRNFGIEQSKGEYLLFVDSDDVVGKYYTETLLNLSLQYHSDIAGCKREKFYDIQEIKKKDLSPSGEMVSEYRGADVWLKAYSAYVTDKIFTKECFKDVRFPEKITIAEDVWLVNTLFDKVGSFVVINFPLYFYRMNSESLSNTPSLRKCLQGLKMNESVCQLPTVAQNPEVLAMFKVHCCRWKLWCMTALAQEKPENWRQKFAEMRKEFLEEITPVQSYINTRYLKTAISVLKISDTAGILYLVTSSNLKKAKKAIQKLRK